MRKRIFVNCDIDLMNHKKNHHIIHISSIINNHSSSVHLILYWGTLNRHPILTKCSYLPKPLSEPYGSGIGIHSKVQIGSCTCTANMLTLPVKAGIYIFCFFQGGENLGSVSNFLHHSVIFIMFFFFREALQKKIFQLFFTKHGNPKKWLFLAICNKVMLLLTLDLDSLILAFQGI